MQPRVYTYKITFEEIPHWYWGVHKEKKFGEFYLGTPSTHRWMWEFYTPNIQILEIFPYTDEGWKEANLIEDRLIKPDINNPLCLNESYGGRFSLSVLRKNGLRLSEWNKLHSEKDELGRSVRNVENAKKMLAVIHSEKDELGRSLLSVKNAEKLHSVKDELGRSVTAVKAGRMANIAKDVEGRSINGVKSAGRLNAEKDELGRSVNAVTGASKQHAQRWQCTETGHISTPCGLSSWQKARNIDTKNRVRIE
jgi:hypothetical protein